MTGVLMARIEDYAIIGDCETVALVGLDGSIDWLCLPRFDSDSCFARLLGSEDNGYWRLAPAKPRSVTRRYHPGTLILETTFVAAGGRVRIIDFMPPKSGNSRIIRVVEGVEGTVEMRSELAAPSDYGFTVPWASPLTEGALSLVAGASILLLHAYIPIHGQDMKPVGSFTTSRGKRRAFGL